MSTTTKQKRVRQLRKRRYSSGSDEESDNTEEIVTKIDDLKELQKLRSKQNGVSVASLALGKKIEKADEITDNDPFKMKTGGFIDMKALKPHQMVTEDGEAIGTAFAAETNRRDEDAEMLRFVEDELAKRRGRAARKKTLDEDANPQEDTLYQLPDRLRLAETKRSEDMLSNQMLSGIPEVDLGIHAKIKNIEATEEAKHKLLMEKMRKKDAEVSDFVPTNMAVNFVQHNRFTIEDSSPLVKDKVVAAPPKPVRVGDADEPEQSRASTGQASQLKTKTSATGEKATDDFHYEKFKKQMRRY
ncbi:splicing factor C9orf78 homolog [Liolophura sinensis]|uniref:splicing factor C9orf78 homolog n=1 Tax=Liolophura sinensis TaxID=3198878 RepID=UPI0031598136